MKFGLAPTQSEPTFDTMRAQARLADAEGFDCLWAHEHHSQGMMYPDPLMTLAVLADATERIGLGTNMLLLPIHHPVRVAQGAAMVDVASGGRLRLGVANGYSPTDLRTFGVDARRRGARLGDGIELIRALFGGEPVTRTGEGFDLEDFVLFPAPVQKPPPVYVGGHAPPAIRRAARLGDGYLISTTASARMVGELVAAYREARGADGPSSRGVALNRIVCVVDSAARKREALAFHAAGFLRLYDSWGHANVEGLDAGQRVPEALGESHFVIGEPAECVERIHAYAELGVDHIACLTSFAFADPAWTWRSIRLMAEGVLPAFG